jgi:UDP:flavonoid glycosyltransferase YjiC (YdhE family)
MKNIALVPRGTGTGHSMRMYAVAKALRAKEKNVGVFVYLESVQTTFQKLFEEIGVIVININPEKIVDYSKQSTLGEKLTWNSTIPNFLGKSFFNSNKVLELLRNFEKVNINLVVSDLDASAILAAKIRKVSSVFVTERFNMPFASMENDKFSEAGFEFELEDIEPIRYIKWYDI